jgi:hypothetical protein
MKGDISFHRGKRKEESGRRIDRRDARRSKSKKAKR